MSEWISVEDRLPENKPNWIRYVLGIDAKGIRYIVAHHPDGVYVHCEDSECELEHDSNDLCKSSEAGFYEECEQSDCEYDTVVFKRDIVKWQPLPEPPEEKKKEFKIYPETGHSDGCNCDKCNEVFKT